MNSTHYQVSTAAALVEGIYQGAVRVGTLREHGDLGLGTFENLDGEMVVVDGQFFQVRADGSVRECDDDCHSRNCVGLIDRRSFRRGVFLGKLAQNHALW
jgi:alpha-acetolactate decarboxylase